MTVNVLRQKYPKFIYEKFEYEFVGDKLEIKFFYSIPCLPAGTAPDHKFTHKISIKPPQLTNCATDKLDNLVFYVGLSIMPSYWKSTCSPVIELKANSYKLSAEQLAFWHKLFIKGMGEYFYKNQIDFTGKDFLTITHPSPELRRGLPAGKAGVGGEVLKEKDLDKNKVLVPIGGGKDSIVTLELLKPHFQVIPFVINPVPVIQEVIKTSELQNFISVNSTIDPCLFELNNRGYLNGHTPVSAFYTFTALLSAYLTDTKFIAFSNERSSNEGNTTYLGHQINHQYSKSLEFEADLNHLITQSLNLSISCFSFLRPLYELQITKLFSGYPQYFNVFSSCNQNFKLTNQQSPINRLWCQHCPKCVSTALMLACFIGKEKVSEIMGSYPPDLQINQSLINQLTGKSDIKPFECVLTRTEAQTALDLIQYDKSAKLDKLLSSWLPNPNMPQEFEKILTEAIHKS